MKEQILVHIMDKFLIQKQNGINLKSSEILISKEEQKQPGLKRVGGPVLPPRQPQAVPATTTAVNHVVSPQVIHLHQLGLQGKSQGGDP